MKSTYFISDIHLGSDTDSVSKDRISRLLTFFQQVEKDGDYLFIVGDLFDFWFEYKTAIPNDHFDILYALKTLLNKGIKIILLRGNHDFWIGNFFTDTLQIPVYDDYIEITLQNKRCHISHGDGIAKNDKGYRFLKRILRHPLNIRLFSLLHPDFGHKLANFSSRMSREHRPDLDIRDDYLDHARLLFENNIDIVVFGHTHVPKIVQENNHVYLNTGDWINEFTYGKLTDGQMTLNKWEQK